MSAAALSYVASDYVAPTDRLIAFGTALLLHGIVIATLWIGVQASPPVLIGIKQSFEMVDLRPYLKQHQTTPVPASIQAEPEPVLEPEPEPEPEPVPIPVQEPDVPEVKVVKKELPKPKPKPKPKPPIAKPVAAKPAEPVPEKVDAAIQDSVVTEKASYSAPSSYAAYLDNPKPRYPRVAKLRGMEGIVKLRVKVGIDGRPVKVDLQQSSGFSALDKAAIKVVRHWRFEPARRGGIKVAGEAIVPIQFKLDKV